ncbi:WD domain, G-beta repeat [Carpediemonas membranifera]|uniref:WD domain, G-beta repeat n=1 Tax=Carpediemonas membranifera TaxID=201153 RepID=A0A8J6B390_9EUKA|nr:WD domain, G-beta repeat [Carpediemonas membranifera]|eukprot:KAG9397395.1 WD domain, G-beta repeat [Carpediemonas membranifera]
MEKYTHVQYLTEGGFGSIYKGIRRMDSLAIVIKKLSGTSLRIEDAASPPSNTNMGPQAIQKRNSLAVFREIAILRVLDHPNIIELLDVFADEMAVCLVLPFFHTDLHNLQKARPLPLPAIRHVIRHVSAGLAYLHSRSFVHRDLKPGNILVDANGNAVITDFGHTCALDGRPLTPQPGSRWYRPPEILFGDTEYGTPADMWALGIIIVEMSTGRPPFMEDGDIPQLGTVLRFVGTPSDDNWPDARGLPDYEKICFDQSEPQSISRLIPDTDPDLADLAGRLLVGDPKRRLTAVQVMEHPFLYSGRSYLEVSRGSYV